MQAFAIDLVLLPPDRVNDAAIKINRTLSEQGPNPIELNKTNCLPHISLLMGRLERHRFESATTALHRLSKEHQTIALKATHLKAINPQRHDSVVSLEFAQSTPLMDLHVAVVEAFAPLLSGKVTEEDMYDAPPIEPSAIQWINDYLRNQSFNNFWPHITLGFGIAPSFEPFDFNVSRLALCHLGNRCTCRKILAETELMSR